MLAPMSTTIDSAQIEQYLAHTSVFEMLEPAHMTILAQLVRTRKLAADEIIWLQGQTVTYFSIVFSGKLRSVRRTSAGSEKLVSILPAGHHFGLAEMITTAASAVTLIADEPTVILTMDYKALRHELLSHNEISYHLMQTMARAIFRLTREIERTSFENVHTRLARLLLVGSRQPPAVNSPQTGQNISHQELAVQLGVSRETVSRVLADFKNKHLIKTGYRTITILNRDGLMDHIEDYDQW